MSKFDCLPDRSAQGLKKITGTSDSTVHQELIQMADFINQADQFSHVANHNANLTLTGFRDGKLTFSVQGTGCGTCSTIKVGSSNLAEIKTVGPLKRSMNEFFGIPMGNITGTVLADLKGAKPNFETFTPRPA